MNITKKTVSTTRPFLHVANISAEAVESVNKMKDIYKTIAKVETILNKCDGYRLEIYSKDKTYSTYKDKKEEPEHDTYAVGFQIPSRNEYEEDD